MEVIMDSAKRRERKVTYLAILILRHPMYEFQNRFFVRGGGLEMKPSSTIELHFPPSMLCFCTCLWGTVLTDFLIRFSHQGIIIWYGTCLT
jgi:hypothetical protein